MIAQRLRNRLASWAEGLPSLQMRISRLIALAVSGAVLIIGLTSFFLMRAATFNALDKELLGAASAAAIPITADVEGLGGLNDTALQTANVNLALVRSDGTLRTVTGSEQSVRSGRAELVIARTQMGISARTVTNINGITYRQVAVPITTSTGKWALIIARPLAPTLYTLDLLGNTLIWLGVALIGLTAGFGWLVGRSILRPLSAMTAAVSRVTETNELAPIGNHSNDEIGQLSRSFDTMMHSLASSRERQKRLIADAGHELRTPLTSMRTNIELLVADQKSNMLPAEARGEILNDVSAQLSEFTNLVGDLVQLSRDDVVAPAREPLDFAEVVKRAVDRAKRRGPQIVFDVDLAPLFIVGEPDTLERAVTNLLDNAVKFSPVDGHIYVRLFEDRLTITDEGPGIAEEDIDKIFDRFYRSNKARNTPGTGLGLSIVAHTISAHGGKVWVSNSTATGGAQFTIELPAAPESELADLEA